MQLLDLQRNVIKSLCDKNNNQATQLLENDRLNIYRNDFVARLIHVLLITYPVCAKITGAVFFRALCMQYIKHYKPTSYNLEDYGAELADFIAHYPHAEQLPYLSDVARLEWYYQRVTIGADVIPYDWQVFANIPEHQQANIIFQLPSNHYLLRSQFPLQQIWQANQIDNNDYEIDWESTENYFFIWRKDLKTQIEKLTRVEWNLLNAIADKKTFAQLSEQEFQLEILLPQLIGKGWVSGFCF